MTKERCNCDASCGENRYHDVGDPECRFEDEDEYRAYWKMRTSTVNDIKDKKMTSTAKIKLIKVNDSFTINMYDNGFMVEISGQNQNEDYQTNKLVVNTVDELTTLINEIVKMDRVN